MKILIVLVLVGLAGCTVSPTPEELETQALLTGDWSAVESRERSLARQKARISPSCPSGYVTYCEDRFYDTVCACLDRVSLGTVLTIR